MVETDKLMVNRSFILSHASPLAESFGIRTKYMKNNMCSDAWEDGWYKIGGHDFSAVRG